jgi:hypothetical protein
LFPHGARLWPSDPVIMVYYGHAWSDLMGQYDERRCCSTLLIEDGAKAVKMKSQRTLPRNTGTPFCSSSNVRAHLLKSSFILHA